MKRLNVISKLINQCNCVYDVGSDHAYLSIQILKNKIANHVVNIDNKFHPLSCGIRNLTKNNFLEKTSNILNDGLKNIHEKIKISPDYIVIAGLGANNIIKILEDYILLNKNTIFILCPNCNSYNLRKWLEKNKFFIEKEQTIYDKKFYQIIVTKKITKKMKHEKINLNFGNKTKQIDLQTWKNFLLVEKNRIIKNKLNLHNPKYQKILEEISYYEI